VPNKLQYVALVRKLKKKRLETFGTCALLYELQEERREISKTFLAEFMKSMLYC